MTGLEIIRAPGATAEQIADIIAEHCSPVAPEHCDKLSCRECWLAWLTTGEPFLVRGRLFVGRPLFLRGLAGGQPCQPALPAGELVAVFGGDGRAVFRDDVHDLFRCGAGGSDDLQAGHFFIPSLYCWTAWFLLYISQSSPSLSMRADRRARAGEVFPSIIPRAASSSLAMLKMLR